MPCRRRLIAASAILSLAIGSPATATLATVVMTLAARPAARPAPLATPVKSSTQAFSGSSFGFLQVQRIRAISPASLASVEVEFPLPAAFFDGNRRRTGRERPSPSLPVRAAPAARRAAPPERRSPRASRPPPPSLTHAPPPPPTALRDGSKRRIAKKTAAKPQTTTPPPPKASAKPLEPPPARSAPSTTNVVRPPAKPPVDLGPSPKYDPGHFGTGVYDVLSWGFWGGDSKNILDMARKDVNAAAVEFSQSVSPALITCLRKIFLQLEENTATGEAAKIRLDFGADWFQAGVATARFLHAVDEAQKAVEGALARYSGMFYEAAGVELESKLVETALKAGALSESMAESLGARQNDLAARREKIQALMRSSIGRDKDFSEIISAEDEAYLTALAKDAGDGFLADARTKLWLTARVEAVISLIEFQVKKKAALEALKMALMAEKNQGTEKQAVIEDFLKYTREGIPMARAIESATESPELRQAVVESQKEFAVSSEAGSQLKMAKALKQLANYDVVPQLRLGLEEGWQEGKGLGGPSLGFHVRWSVTSALRLLWSGEDLKAPQLEEDIAKANVIQAARDKTYNFDRADAAIARYTQKAASDGLSPTAEDIALYGRAKLIRSYSPEVAIPDEIAPPKPSTSTTAAVGTLKDLLEIAVEHSPSARAAQLRLEQSDENIKKSRQWMNVEVGVGGGAVVVDSLLPSLVVTLENLGRQKEAAQVKRLASALRRAKTAFELMYSALHYANDYLYALETLDDAKEAVAAAAAAKDRHALAAAEGARIEAEDRARQMEAELRRLLGDGVALPTKDALARIFSLGNDQLYWGSSLFKQFNMDATLNEAAQRVKEDLVDTQKALSGVPELRIHLSSIFTIILSPAMPWMNVLTAMDAAQTAMPMLSWLFSETFPGQAEKEREAKLVAFYHQLWANKKTAEALSGEYTRQREDLKTMGPDFSDAPKSAEEAHQLNRWRIAALAYEIAPGAEDFLSDRIVAMVEKGRLKEAAEFWTFSHAGEKLEAGGKPSAAGELLRRKLNESEEFKRDLAHQILGAHDWFEAKCLFDPWLEDFQLDFVSETGGEIVAKIVKEGYVAFFDGGKTEGDAGDASVVPQLKEAVDKGDRVKAYELYRKQLGFESRKKAASGAASAPAVAEAPALTAGNLTDASQRRSLSRRVITLLRAGKYAKGQELLAAATETYRAAGLDFDKYYPGLKSWTVGTISRSAEPATRKTPSLDLAPPPWLHDGIHSLPDMTPQLQPIRRVLRLNAEWDLLNSWSSVSLFESRVDRERRLSETLSIMRENAPGGELERRQYSFAGPMGALGDLRLNAAGTLPLARENAWNPLSPLKSSSDDGRDSYGSLGLTQRGLLPGFDLSEKAVYRLLGNGASHAEYGLGASGIWNGSYNFGDLTLLRDMNPRLNGGKVSNHFRTSGRLGYGRMDDLFSSALGWQADDLYGYKSGQISGEYSLSGRYRPSLLPGLETELFGSGAAYKNRNYLSSGRYYTDTYIKDTSRFVSADELGVPRTDGTAAYAGLRQMLVDGKYGGIGMGYAVQSQTGERPRQYGTASYIAPGGHSQLDLITSDDPSVGPAAVQTQLLAGPALARLGVDASSYTAVAGARDPSGNLTLTGRLAQSVRDSSSRAWGAAISTVDSDYSALWSNHGRGVSASIYQGDLWLGNGLQFDYLKSDYAPGETYRVKMALSALTEASDWTRFVPFAPLAKGIYGALGSVFAANDKDGASKEKVAEELGATTSRSGLAKKAADLLESAGRKASGLESANRSTVVFLNDTATSVSNSYGDFRRQANTRIPYSWKPDFSEFLASLSALVPQLRQAQESVLFERSERFENSWFAWTPKVVDQLDDVLRKYETYRAAYREQIMAIPVSGGIDRRPLEIADFNKKSQWFVDYLALMKAEFLEMDRIGKLPDAALSNQLAALYRLRDESPSENAPVPAKKALAFLGASSWLPTTADIPIRVLESRISRLIAERQRRAEIDARAEKIKARAGHGQTGHGHEGPLQ